MSAGHTIVAGYHGINLTIRVSVSLSFVRPSVRPFFRFRAFTMSKCQWILPNSVCALILWRSALGLLMGKFRKFLTELSARDRSVFSFIRMLTLVIINGFSQNLVCAWTLW